MNTENKNIKQRKKRIWRSVVTTLAAIVVFTTTYALIIPAITWEKTLICELEEHVHTDNCYNSRGELTCGKEEHKHIDSCFDAPKAIEKLYICGKAEHTHTDDCYFSDGTLKCTLPEHQHTMECKNNVRTVVSEPASDGAVAVIYSVIEYERITVNVDDTVDFIESVISERTAGVKEERTNNEMSSVTYDGTLIIGGVDEAGQFDFVPQIDIGDELSVTDMKGYVFTYTVSTVKHAKNAKAKTLIDEKFDLTLFAKDKKTGDWLLVRCNMK